MDIKMLPRKWGQFLSALYILNRLLRLVSNYAPQNIYTV